MSDRAPVSFDQVSKRFDRGERHDSLRDLLPAAVGRLFGAPPRDEFWALQDVSFEVQRGEAFGIIGPNGAGKSTALKLLTKLLAPTRGTCRVTGQVGALIEVAAGFHPDLTGRENIYLQGAILGMHRAQIASRLDAIVDFAGVEAFLDTPIKRYSSGMNARLGFSIAAHLDPDVLIIDEVLSVGDLAFRQKCQARMREFRDRGVAIVFVSHDLPSVLKLCGRSMLLHKGRVLMEGATRDVVSHYSTVALVSHTSNRAGVNVDVVEPQSSGDVWVLGAGAPITFRVEAAFREGVERCGISVDVSDLMRDARVFTATSSTLGLTPVRVAEGDRIAYEMSLVTNLTSGLYTLSISAIDHDSGEMLSTPWKKRFSVVEETSLEGPANLFLRGHRWSRGHAAREPRPAALEVGVAGDAETTR